MKRCTNTNSWSQRNLCFDAIDAIVKWNEGPWWCLIGGYAMQKHHFLVNILLIARMLEVFLTNAFNYIYMVIKLSKTIFYFLITGFVSLISIWEFSRNLSAHGMCFHLTTKLFSFIISDEIFYEIRFHNLFSKHNQPHTLQNTTWIRTITPKIW